MVELNTDIGANHMQKMAADYNQPATSFIWRDHDYWYVKWFAPDGEIELCGHGSFAALGHLFHEQNMKHVKLRYGKGYIIGKIKNSNYCSISLQAIYAEDNSEPEKALINGLGVDILARHKTNNKNIVTVRNESVVKNMQPDFATLSECQDFGFVITAPGDKVDFVSRTLVPHVKQLEDPATGSSHTILTPYWSSKLGKKRMTAHQLSNRGGKFVCEIEHDLVTLSGEFKRLVKGVATL